MTLKIKIRRKYFIAVSTKDFIEHLRNFYSNTTQFKYEKQNYLMEYYIISVEGEKYQGKSENQKWESRGGGR